MKHAVTLFAVKLPVGGNAPHGRIVKFTNRRDRDNYLRKCCENSVALDIPPVR
jgi:hypothetical protein